MFGSHLTRIGVQPEHKNPRLMPSSLYHTSLDGCPVIFRARYHFTSMARLIAEATGCNDIAFGIAPAIGFWREVFSGALQARHLSKS